VFERLFGEGGTATERREGLKRKASLLDWVHEDITRLQGMLGPGDRVKVSEYLDSVREVERRIQKAEAQSDEGALPDVDRPAGVPAAYADHARLMFDLQVLALQADVTRVITFQLARESSNRTYPEIGVPDPHHPTSHHGNDPEKVAKLAKINQFNPNVHDHVNLPIVVAGGGGGTVRGGQHIVYDEPAPMANLHLTLLDSVGVRLDSFADSTGRIDTLAEPVHLAG